MQDYPPGPSAGGFLLCEFPQIRSMTIIDRAAEIADEFEHVAFEAATQINPVQELLHATHDRIYSRLFQS